MDNDDKVLRNQLEKQSYRNLQQTTKALSLPANLKKVYLIDLIIARKRGRTNEENEIILKAKQERIKSSYTRRQSKRRMNMQEEKKTRKFYSPPITATPRHNRIALQRNRRFSLLKRLTNSPKHTKSPKHTNRILRSCNIRRQSFRNVVDFFKGNTTDDCLNLPACIVRSQPDLSISMIDKNQHIKNVSTEDIQPAKRQRAVSGIYPLIKNDVQINGVCLRRKDGTVSKINAIVQRRTYEHRTNTDYIQHVLTNLNENLNIENNNNLDPTVTDSGFSEENVSDVSLNEFNYSYQKTFEEIKYRKYENGLPKIADVFSKFNGRQEHCQPLHVNVNETERNSVNPAFIPQSHTNTIMLESLYNFKNNFLIQTSLPQISKADTKSVTCISTIVTAKVHPTTADMMHNYSCGPESTYRNNMNQRLADFLKCSEQGTQRHSLCSADITNTISPTDTSNTVDDSVSIPEMVEDAFEIISQDGDYMERLGMDVKACCVICNWTGHTIVMEYHIRKEHPNQILQETKSEWNITYTLASLVTDCVWFSRVIEYNSVLYILSAKYEDPNCFMATLSSLSTDILPQSGSITIYNKVSGEPYTWQGDIEPLPPNLPYENKLNCLKLNLATLDLLPNSANLKLVNRELVCDSPNKVVIGQPELRDIHIILFVRVIV